MLSFIKYVKKIRKEIIKNEAGLARDICEKIVEII